MKLVPNDTGKKCSLQRRAAAWRMSCRRLANVDDLRNLPYDSAAGYGNPHSELFTL